MATVALMFHALLIGLGLIGLAVFAGHVIAWWRTRKFMEDD